VPPSKRPLRGIPIWDGTPVVIDRLSPHWQWDRVRSGLGTIRINWRAEGAPPTESLALLWESATGTQLARSAVSAPDARRDPIRIHGGAVLLTARRIREVRRFQLAADLERSPGALGTGSVLVIASGSGASCQLQPAVFAGSGGSAPASGLAPLLAGYVVDGRLVLRCLPREDCVPSRQAWAARFAYHRVAW
jgi:hypothetical protein